MKPSVAVPLHRQDGMSSEVFRGGHVEWSGHDEDGPLRGLAEITQARLARGALSFSFVLDGSAYEVHLVREREGWSGRFARLRPGAPLASGRCSLAERGARAGERRFQGSWIENGKPYAVTLSLRATREARPRRSA